MQKSKTLPGGRISQRVVALAAAVFCSWPGINGAVAEIRLPAIFSDHVVLEKSSRVPVWGWAGAGERVEITLGKMKASATAGREGRWETSLDLSKAEPGPLQMIVEGRNRIVVDDVLVGEVWVASGQSNMEWRLAQTTGAEAEIARSANPNLRFFQAEKIASSKPADQIRGRWIKSEPATVPATTAVGYYFGKRLQEELGVPVGIINSNWGGTPVEAWTSPDALKSVPDLRKSSEQMWTDIPDFPGRQRKFAAELPLWLKTVGRENPPVENLADFAGSDVPTDDWKPVELPGDLSAQGLPAAGIYWLRKDVQFAGKPGGELRLTIGEADRFDALYWNGRLVKEYTPENYAELGPRRVYAIPVSMVEPGRNVVALRIFAPLGPTKFVREPSGLPFEKAGQWMSKVEREFPDLAEGVLSPAMPPSPPYPQHVAGAIFNGMINPLIPYAIKGVIWYQGEANVGRAAQYREAFPLLVKDWRSRWNQGDFSFYFCQLPNFGPKKDVPSDSAWAELREAQNFTLSQPNTAQAVLIELGEAGDVHPRNKKDVGERLAGIALARDYGKRTAFSGPVYKSMKIEGGKARLSFDCGEEKLVAAPVSETYLETAGHRRPLHRNSPDSELEGFAVCGQDGVWHWANAAIEPGDRVAVWSEKVPQPVAVRYAWADNPNANLVSSAGLPASPFRTDDFTLTTAGAKY